MMASPRNGVDATSHRPDAVVWCTAASPSTDAAVPELPQFDVPYVLREGIRNIAM